MAQRFEIIGVRRLSRNASNKYVTVSLGKPQKMKGGDWKCPFQITGIRGIRYGYGIDAIQAITTALEGIRVILGQSREGLSWAGGEAGDPGFDRILSTSFGLKFTRRLNRIVDREIVRFVRTLESRHRSARSIRGK
jgi:hypothetical protein